MNFCPAPKPTLATYAPLCQLRYSTNQPSFPVLQAPQCPPPLGMAGRMRHPRFAGKQPAPERCWCKTQGQAIIAIK